MEKVKYGVMILIILCLFGCSQHRYSAPLSTSPRVNLAKYVGRWFEIASIPMFSQNGCRCTQSNLSLANHYISVINTCLKHDHFVTQVAKAWVVPGSADSKLKVQFFWPFKADYWILYHDKKYKTAIVGEPSREYLWILARTPMISHKRYQRLIKIVRQAGYDVSQLRITPQTCPLLK